MFLLRGAVGLALIVMLLPTEEANQAKVTGTAGAAIARAATFCDRNAHTCAAAAELWATFVKKAEFGAKLAGKMLQDWMRSDGAAHKNPLERASSPDVAPQNVIGQSRGTLTPRDLGPAWRGGQHKTGA